MQKDSQKSAIVLLSGGLDSATLQAVVRSQGFRVIGLTFSYGQRHSVELEVLNQFLLKYPVDVHRIVKLDLSCFDQSALINDRIKVAGSSELSPERVPNTYVPARNTIFLSYALGLAETLGAYDLFFGGNALDYDHYPDCRPEYLKSFEDLANLATAAGVGKKGRYRIHAPFIRMSKAEIIKQGLSLGVDYSLTTSCYDPTPEGLACGVCGSCALRLQGFLENKIKDPISYARSSIA